MHGIQRRGGAGRRIFQPLLCLLLACALLSRFSSASAEYGADFDYLHTLNPDIAGWLYSEDGLIDQAVLQAADNQTYRKLRYDRSTYYYGSVFMDCEASADFSDPVTILYGSPGIDEGPFSFLRDYMEKDYALTHSRLLLLTPNGNQDIQLFAAFTVPYDDEESWRLDQVGAEAAFQQALKTQTERSVFSLPENLPEYGDRVLVMATTGDSRQRMVVMGKLTAREPSADVTDIFKKELDDRETGNGRVTIDGVGSFMVYAQNDPVYARLTFEVASSKKYRIFGHGGCGPTAAAMILANLLTSEELTRLDQFTENGEGFYFCPCSVNQFHCQSYHVKYHPTRPEEFQRYLPILIGNMATGNNCWGIMARSTNWGSSLNYLEKLADGFGLQIEKNTDLHETVAALQDHSKQRLALTCATWGSPFTLSSHFEVMCYADDEWVYFLDPLRDNNYAKNRTGSLIDVVAPGVVRIPLDKVYDCNISSYYIVERP